MTTVFSNDNYISYNDKGLDWIKHFNYYFREINCSRLKNVQRTLLG